jgi:putative membrane protein
MILTKKPSIKLLYTFTKNNFWFLIITSSLACIAIYFIDVEIFKGLAYPTGFIGTALAFLIGFRNNSAYDRWWEARKIWGKLINDSRHFALRTIGLISNTWDDKLSSEDIKTSQKKLIYRHIAFVWALNKHLRKNEWQEAVQPFLEKEEFEQLKKEKHIPLALLKNQTLDIKNLFETKYIEDFRHMQFDNIMENFNDAIGKSERIKNTVFPMQYNWYMQYAIWVFLFMLPFSLAGYLGYWFSPFSLTIGYVFILLEYLGKHLENPFNNSPNDTPIDALSRTIEINLKEVLGEDDLPEAIQPINGKYLM